MLIVTNEGTLRVGRQGGLAGTGETKENGDVAVLTLVGGRVKGQDVVLDWHFVVHDGEDTVMIVRSWCAFRSAMRGPTLFSSLRRTRYRE